MKDGIRVDMFRCLIKFFEASGSTIVYHPQGLGEACFGDVEHASTE